MNFCAKHVLKHATTLHIYIYIHIRIARKTTGRKHEEKKKKKLEKNILRTKNERRVGHEVEGEKKEEKK